MSVVTSTIPCKVIIGVIFYTGLIVPIRAVAEQSISGYNPTAPVIVARQEAVKAGLDPKLVLAIMWHESRDCKLLTTPKTDLGCFQIKRSTALKLHLDLSRLVTDKAYNIRAGVTILKSFKRNKPDWWTAYNVGYRNLPIAAAAYKSKVGYK